MRRTVLMAMVMLGAALGLASGAMANPAVVRVCGHASPGHAHCDASLLASRRNHDLIRPAVPTADADDRTAHVAASSGQPQTGSPQWLQQAYDLTALSASNGGGDTIAIVDPYDDPNVASDLATFRQTYGLSACGVASGCLRVLNEEGVSSPLPAANPAWETEETIDIEAASSVCPNCNLILVEASGAGSADLLTSMQTAAKLGANQISDSWSITSSGSPFPSNLVTPSSSSAVAPAVFAAAGDEGTDDLGEAEYPAALPTVTAVGGTTLTPTDSRREPRGYSESAWSDAGSGCALQEQPLAYQPASGCAGRAYSDVSADADPNTGLNIYQASEGGWAVSGGTSLATPIVAAFDAVTGIDAQTPQWAYEDAAALNDPTDGSNGECAGSLQALLCTAGVGYDGPTGAGSVSGAVVAGVPGIASPVLQAAGHGTAVVSVSRDGAELAGGIYPNQEATSYVWQYGTSSSYASQTAAVTLPAAAGPLAVSVHLSGLAPDTVYHYRLVATNASGTADGYDMTFTTGTSRAASSGFNASFVSTSSPKQTTKRSVSAAARIRKSKQGLSTAHRPAGLGALGRLAASARPLG